MITQNRKTSMLRVSAEHWLSDEKFAELLIFLERYGDVIDSVALFDSYCHTPIKLEISAKYNALLSERIREIKSKGFSCGINILATIGHHEQYLDMSFQENYTRMTDRFGKICRGSFCMNDSGYLENYIKPKYILMLSADPDFIWIDDDIRYMHFPIGYGCFCDNCIKKFNKDYDYDFTRESLVQRLNDDNEIELRKKWLLHQSDKVENLLSFIADVVYSRTDKVKLGLMTGERYFEGFRFEGWAKALSDNGKRKIMWRPGGGAYNDLDFSEFTQKSIEIGRQTALLPDYVDEVLSEIESFPYQQIKKSPNSTVTEAIMYLASGCNGTAWNVLPGYADSGESITAAENTFKKLQTKSEFFKKLSLAFSDNHPLGIYDGWHKNGQAVTTKSFFESYGGMYADTMSELELIGLPHAYNFDTAGAYLLKGRQPLAYSHDEIIKMLSKSVYIDAEAVGVLESMGYGEYIGFKCGKAAPADALEVYANHPCNTGIVGKKRASFPVFSRAGAYELIPPEDAEIIASLENIHGDTVSDCSVGLYKNKLGGTVAAAGYYPWVDLVDSQKSLQMKNIFQSLMPDYPLCYIYSYHRVRVYIRKTLKGISVILFNCNGEELTDVRLFAAVREEKAALTDEMCEETLLTATSINEKNKIFTLPKLLPYKFYLLNF